MIVAVIVTYEPDLTQLARNLVAVAPQVDRVVVFDNGSTNRAAISDMISGFDAELLQSPTNVGIARALNVLVERASELGADTVLTLDQDSVCSPGMVDALAGALDAEVAMATPFIIDINKMSVDDYSRARLPETERFAQAARRGAITSGSLLKIEAWRLAGRFDDSLFIDYVDYDFNQRLMCAGLSILRVNRTYLLHEVGRAKPTFLWIPRKSISGKWKLERFYSFGHSASRCYFKARNRVVFTRKYWRVIGITHEGVWQLPQQIILTLLFEEGKWPKLRAFARGTWDGIRLTLP